MEPAQEQSKQPQKDDKPLLEFARDSFAKIQHALAQYNFVAADKTCAALSKRVESECFRSNPLRIDTLRCSSRIAECMHDFQRAEEALSKAIMITAADAIPSQRDEQLCALRIVKARFLASRGRYHEALCLWQLASEQEGVDASFRIAALLGTAQTYRMQGLQQLYARFMQQAFSEMPQTVEQGLSTNHADTLAQAADSELEAGRFSEAAILYEQSAIILQKLPQLPHVKAAQIRAAQLQVSECLEKAGEFQRASRLQSQLLSDSVSTLGADNPVTMSLRNSLAKSLIGQNGRDFERAELLLNDNIAAAERLNETKLIVRAKVALAAARADRGMYEEAVKDFVSIMEDLPKDLDVFERIRVRSELAHVLIECGDEKLSEQVLKASAADVADTDGVRAIAVKASLAFGIAKVFAFENPDKARESLAECYSYLESMPPGLEVIPSSNLRQLALILSQSVNDNDESWDRHIELTIKEHQQKFGQSEPIVDAQLTVSIAMRLLKKGEIEQGRALLEKVKVNLDSLHHNNGMLYAVVLELLAKHLEPGDARASAYEEKANEIRQSADRAIEAWKKSGADED